MSGSTSYIAEFLASLRIQFNVPDLSDEEFRNSVFIADVGGAIFAVNKVAFYHGRDKAVDIFDFQPPEKWEDPIIKAFRSPLTVERILEIKRKEEEKKKGKKKAKQDKKEKEEPPQAYEELRLFFTQKTWSVMKHENPDHRSAPDVRGIWFVDVDMERLKAIEGVKIVEIGKVNVDQEMDIPPEEELPVGDVD